ncbi:MAG: hypothetical protein SPF70_04985 [Lachnospiraceae bacterium]|nr:hypothetical protein [Lachnospiraceae bacterium]
MEENITEAVFMALGMLLFILAITLLIIYQNYFRTAYEELYRLSENEYVIREVK